MLLDLETSGDFRTSAIKTTLCLSVRGEDLNVIFYQNMPNLHNLYKSAERNIPQKNSGIYVKLLLAM